MYIRKTTVEQIRFLDNTNWSIEPNPVRNNLTLVPSCIHYPIQINSSSLHRRDFRRTEAIDQNIDVTKQLLWFLQHFFGLLNNYFYNLPILK